MTTAQNQYALVTGATSGIGYELAKLFANDQYNLVIVARNQDELDRTAAELSQSGAGPVAVGLPRHQSVCTLVYRSHPVRCKRHERNHYGVAAGRYRHGFLPESGDGEGSKMVQKTSLSDPASVAKNGYEALFAGDDKVISGLRNKRQVAISNVMPESRVADTMNKQQEPVDKKP